MIGWGGRLSVHDRLGERVGHFPRNQEELEEMADARVPDKFIVAPCFKNKTRYTPYVSLGSQISHIVSFVDEAVSSDFDEEPVIGSA